MKKRIYGVSLIALMLALLFLFPFLGTFLPGSSVHVTSENQEVSPFFLKDEQAPIVFVYFGYVGCARTCTPSLQEIAKVYESLKTVEAKTKIYFVNLNPDQYADAPDLFAKGFHPDFKGIYASQKQIDQVARVYNLNITSSGNEMGHTSALFMFVKRPSGYVLKNIYTTHPYSLKHILTDMQKALK